MIQPDVNLLVYAHNTAAPEHLAAKTWWEASINSGITVLIPAAVALGFVRIITNRKAVQQPLTTQTALAMVQEWFTFGNVRLLEVDDSHWVDLGKVLDATNWTGPAISDAHLAALAISEGAVLQSNDTDFASVPNLQWANPLQTGQAGPVQLP